MAMHFHAILDRLPGTLPSVQGPAPTLPPLRLAPFADDIELAHRRLKLRVCIRSHAGRLQLDFGDSDPLGGDNADFALDSASLHTACTVALAHALGYEPHEELRALLNLQHEPTCIVTQPRCGANPAAVAMCMARVYDVVLGALRSAWPGRVGAGSCSLGAVVELGVGKGAERETFTDTVSAGEGATPTRPGRQDWSGPILAAHSIGAWPAWLSVSQQTRRDSGGGGARRGGDGTTRRYTVTRDVEGIVAIDRRTNPPHGVEQAGPPRGAELYVVSSQGRRAIPAWEMFSLAAHETLVVETAGGAGHGFPGYGDIEFDASQWFAG